MKKVLSRLDLQAYTLAVDQGSHNGTLRESTSHRKSVLTMVREPTMTDLRCMSYMGKGQDQLLVAGCQNIMLRIDVAKGKVLEEVDRPRPFARWQTDCARYPLLTSIRP